MRNGRCRLHGGLSTGPRTPEGLARSRRARWTHGGYSVEAQQRYRDLKAACHAQAVAAATHAASALADGQQIVHRLRTDLRNRRRRKGSRTGGHPVGETTPTATRVLQEIARLAFSTVPVVFDEHGHLHPISRLADHGASYSSVHLTRRRTIAPAAARTDVAADHGRGHATHGVDIVCKTRCAGKLKALEMLVKHHGLLQRHAQVRERAGTG